MNTVSKLEGFVVTFMQEEIGLASEYSKYIFLLIGMHFHLNLLTAIGLQPFLVSKWLKSDFDRFKKLNVGMRHF